MRKGEVVHVQNALVPHVSTCHIHNITQHHSTPFTTDFPLFCPASPVHKLHLCHFVNGKLAKNGSAAKRFDTRLDFETRDASVALPSNAWAPAFSPGAPDASEPVVSGDLARGFKMQK